MPLSRARLGTFKVAAEELRFLQRLKTIAEGSSH